MGKFWGVFLVQVDIRGGLLMFLLLLLLLLLSSTDGMETGTE